MIRTEKNILYLVIPCFNEEEVLTFTAEKSKEKLCSLIALSKISPNSKILFVNDGSKDKTWQIIRELSEKNSIFTGISLSKNGGHQNALLAGLMTAKKYADIVISMDADLQDDINAIDEMIDKYKSGAEIVYGVRASRKSDSWFKRTTAQSFYKFMRYLGVDIVYNHADFRLSSKRVLEKLEDFGEVNIFLRGIFPLIGFKSDIVYYDRKERLAGKTKYPKRKMLSFAWDGITSFSIKPIRMILNLGILIFLASVIIMIYTLAVKLLGKTVDGWTFIVISIWLIAGIQMFSIGLIGEYIGKIYSETKNRPKYIIDEDLNEE
ncbi:MAG: glycosyltransferase family 2 protein [Clostridia bacterium]|nr:glycosyltransferase family 2 protein [Clostridia bacterium]